MTLLEVTTCNPASPRGDGQKRTARIDPEGGLAFITEEAGGVQGTTVRVRLNKRFDSDESLAAMEGYLRSVVVRPAIPVHCCIRQELVLAQSKHFTIRSTAKEILEAKGREIVLLQLSRFSDEIGGVVALVLARNGEWLSYRSGAGYLRFGQSDVDPLRILSGYAGNRVIVNGFPMSLRKANRLLGYGKTRLAIAYDLDVRGTSKVVYDVSRNRIVGDGAAFVKKALRNAIVRGLRETGVYAQLDDVTKKLVHGGDPTEEELAHHELVKEVRVAVAERQLSFEMVNKIADQFTVDVSVVRRIVRFVQESERQRSSGATDLEEG